MIPVVDADLFDGAENLEASTQVSPGRSLLDLADVDDASLLDLPLLLLLQMARLLLPTLSLAAETLAFVAPGRKKNRKKLTISINTSGILYIENIKEKGEEFQQKILKDRARMAKISVDFLACLSKNTAYK